MALPSTSWGRTKRCSFPGKSGVCQNPGAEMRNGNRVWLAAPSSRRWVPPRLPLHPFCPLLSPLSLLPVLPIVLLLHPWLPAPRFLRLHLLQDHLPPLSFLPNPLENPAWREFPRPRPFVTAVPAGSGGTAATTPLRRPAGAGDGAVPRCRWHRALPVALLESRLRLRPVVTSLSGVVGARACSGCWSLSQHLAGTNVTRTASPERPLCLWQWP